RCTRGHLRADPRGRGRGLVLAPGRAMRRSRGQTMTSSQAPWPLAQHPAVPTHVLVCRDDRFFPAELLHRVTRERLGIEAQEVPGCHCAMLSHPHELAEALMWTLPGAPQ